ncbi:hypothetical protein B7463_g3376, partial [Scytalidium lignicola]
MDLRFSNRKALLFPIASSLILKPHFDFQLGYQLQEGKTVPINVSTYRKAMPGDSPPHQVTINGTSARDGAQAYAIVNYGSLSLPDPNGHQNPFNQGVSACQNALFLTDPDVDRESLISTKGTRVAGTCEWIRQNENYQSWLYGTPRLLWISGDPGKGKTMLSIFLTQDLEQVTQNMEQAGLIFYFCSNQDEKRNTAVAVLRGLLYQIIAKRPNLLKHVLPHLETPAKAQQTLSSLETLWIIFRRVIQNVDLGPIFCVLDGLDECDEESLRVLVPKIVELLSAEMSQPASIMFKMAIISRNIPGLQSCLQVKLEPDNEERVANDIERFISARVEELSRIKGFNDEFRATVYKTLLERSEGTFLWVGFIMNELSQKMTCSEVLETLEDLPKGLSPIYSRMLLQINSRRRQTSAKILRWVTMALRPLSLQELAAAVSIQSSSTLINAERAILDEITLCGLFLKVQGQEVSLVHQSAKDYLMREEVESNPVLEEFRIKPERAHLELARTCFDCVSQSSLQNARLSITDGSQVPGSPLLSYAVFHWPEHVRCCSTLASELFSFDKPFFQKHSDLRKNWWTTYTAYRILEGESVPLLHTMCNLGIVTWVAAILRKKSWRPRLHKVVDKKDPNGRTALYIAASLGHEAVVRLLLKHGADVNIKVIENGGHTALYDAAFAGNERIVQLLAEHGADVNAEVDGGQTALYDAAFLGHKEVVRVLLDYGADINTTDTYGQTALFMAASVGHTAVVQLLVDRGADVNRVAKSEQTALYRAVCAGHEAVVRILVKSGAEIKTNAGDAALLWAASVGQMAIAQLLIDHGARVNARVDEGRTALYEAAFAGHESIVRLLIEHGAEVNAVDDYGQTALHEATFLGHKGVVRLLKSAGAT